MHFLSTALPYYTAVSLKYCLWPLAYNWNNPGSLCLFYFLFNAHALHQVIKTESLALGPR